MQISRAFIIFGSLLFSALLSFNAQAGPFTYGVSANAADNPAGVLGPYTASGQWTSGDLSLPGGTTIGSTPLEVEITLSQNLTLNNAPGGSELYGWGLAGLSPEVPAFTDAGQVMMELLENGTVVSPMFGFDDSFIPVPVTAYGVASSASLPVSAVFNQVDVFITDSMTNPPESVTDLEISLNASVAGVPDACNTLPLFALGCVAMLGLAGAASRRVPALCRQGSRPTFPKTFGSRPTSVAKTRC